ncbi:LacI family DNA-binding transcriptional regulator [Asticcacaulis sp. EMRT-3]|uniref:LacI family DNA-binding transcriptional regulator n=1 Tax=Asticcacaulis sp. EMRT-3 TaxID=3040349 RepID=UPI0024AFB949|nr:LacI family DNA-binding transcriptional regulator [Asticcacaulis sp. EMRT-3]MDI7776491.1 LacI family DNA-binding transcriptional regulator [Asticcacaulis sp. EMRT-3]
MSEASEQGDFAEFESRRRRATINDVARLAKVSKKTVSRIINNSPNVREETRERVNEVIARVNFRPTPQARSLAFRRSFLISMIYDNPNAQYIVTMQASVLERLRGSGIELVVHPCDRKSPDFSKDLRDFIEVQRPAGVIILPPLSENAELLTLLEEYDVPFVRITAHPGSPGTALSHGHQVISLDRASCRAAAEHLIGLGHRRIGFITGPAGYASSVERDLGFNEGLAAHGLALAKDHRIEGAYTFDSGYEAAQTLLSLPQRPTAIFAANDEMATGVYRAAMELGLKIPGDLSLIGFDDSPIASWVSPPLTTVRMPITNMGRAAAECLIGEHDARLIHFESILVVRGSTSPPLCDPQTL